MSGKNTQGFFSEVVSGNSKRYTPKRCYQYEHQFEGQTERAVRDYMDSHKGPFDEHIATSIPTFRDIQVATAAAVAKVYTGQDARVLDIGGSEGGWVKAIAQFADVGEAVCLDPNPDMEVAFGATDTPPGAVFERAAFLEGWDDIPAYNPPHKFDVVHESMTFQFIDDERGKKVAEVKRLLKPNGVFLTEEKFRFPEGVYRANEVLKDTLHKSRYYDNEQLATKAEKVLVGMKSGQADYEKYREILSSNFKHVREYWRAGNFRGFMASDDPAALARLEEALEPITEGERYTYPIGGRGEHGNG